ncbi:MAG TPA: pyridoxal-phosphate dependent enzyme [Streptosporangiaceae bacterium]|nr:pyridoxal-phosphate dependent enzyme [Streptosporangiaceae bacterium]
MNVVASERLEAEVRIPSPLERLADDWLEDLGIQVWLKRDDLIHPDLPGNKWRKLKYNLTAAAGQGQRTLLTFGGAYSNHLRATAAAGRYCGFATIGIIRGEEHIPLNPSLAYAVQQGMRLSYLDRQTYRRKTDLAVMDSLRREFGQFYLLPEGGSNELAVRGCSELPAEIKVDFDVICCPCGTGATLAGIAAGLESGRRAVGLSALKGAEFLESAVADLQVRAFGHRTDNWHIEHGFHCGGFAKENSELESFIAGFRRRNGLNIDRIYVAKMLHGIYSLAQAQAFKRGSRIVAVITGPQGPDW